MYGYGDLMIHQFETMQRTATQWQCDDHPYCDRACGQKLPDRLDHSTMPKLMHDDVS